MSRIYHIATRAEWERARQDGQYTMSTRGRTLAEQGFIHGSTEQQVESVANRIFEGVPDLVVLVIDPDKVSSEIKYDQVDGWNEPFPHIYGPLNTDAVVEVRPLETRPDGRFTFVA